MRKIDSKKAFAIGFFAAIGLPILIVVAHRIIALPVWLPLIVFLGLTFYFLRDKLQAVLFGAGVGTVFYVVGLFLWATVNGIID